MEESRSKSLHVRKLAIHGSKKKRKEIRSLYRIVDIDGHRSDEIWATDCLSVIVLISIAISLLKSSHCFTKSAHLRPSYTTPSFALYMGSQMWLSGVVLFSDFARGLLSCTYFHVCCLHCQTDPSQVVSILMSLFYVNF